MKLKKAQKQAIDSSYGDQYSKPRNYKGKSKGAQEAHEAISPTDFSTIILLMQNAIKHDCMI